MSSIPADASAAVLKKSDPIPEDTVSVQGPNFEEPISLQGLLQSYERIGFQANSLSKAISIVNKMRAWRLSDELVREDEADEYKDTAIRAQTRCNVFLGYTSNLISSGLREIILYLVKHKHVAAIVTTAGGIEEDFIKCLGKTYLADFNLDGADLRRRGMNRIGNLVVPNDNYCKFEDWLIPILDTMLEEQKASGDVWTPSKLIRRLGKEINHEESVYYWAYKNDIPVFCPALTDGSLGDMLYFHSFRSPGLVVDIVQDIRNLNELARKSKKAGMIILGGGICKHQIANSMLFRNGADYSVYINTGQEFDGSDSGARPDEAVSWGKIRAGAETVKASDVYADATLVFPLLVAATFAQKPAVGVSPENVPVV
ncbi:Deoxyhypusine synthase [Punctularia strigosozonata HHB-11173 SS5]|uniref:Deoxyhypusine synthase n=1 Tax=Punctularia strigosozonata (strain HHB-11173) TaxID=741275 RepID=UPI00044183CA|nr:Deoxyhypusine synthase [Punctularia strigosozonata HHB-11173 SS5]EIN10768.1 Deoxyhypusine synthase [Punctularia strigosozonata HHB-11173 SS5]